MKDLLHLIASIRLADVLDIALVSIVFFTLFRLLLESRSRVALEGLLTVLMLSFLMYFVSRVSGLNAMQLIFERFWIIAVLAALIVFQHEFRRVLTDIGQLRILRALFHQSSAYLEEIVQAVQAMSTKRTGALIAIERRNPLRLYAETGTALDCVVSSEMLRTIFTPYSPLHDGAVIIRDERAVAAACILPLTSDSSLSKELGTRHRAAIGLSEETDALVLVVSEETGIISLAIRGQLERNFSTDDLRRRLMDELNVEVEEPDEEEAG